MSGKRRKQLRKEFNSHPVTEVVSPTVMTVYRSETERKGSWIRRFFRVLTDQVVGDPGWRAFKRDWARRRAA